MGGMAVTSTMEYNNLSLFFAFASLFPDMMVLLFFIIPVKVKWLAYLDAAWLLYGVVSLLLKGAYISALLPVLAILNYLIFFGDSLIEALRGRASGFSTATPARPSTLRRPPKRLSRRPVIFTSAVSAAAPDADYPDLEFRYCSKCAGYRCYCMDHINNHVHVTEE